MAQKGVGKCSSKEIYKYLMQADKLRMLQQQLQCDKVVPRIEISEQELKNHLKRAPPGNILELNIMICQDLMKYFGHKLSKKTLIRSDLFLIPYADSSNYVNGKKCNEPS